ncbi:uncharacterized protein LOC117314670 isoform X2 [Pecten maximus]|nr:uncharacterized protein LOC117314670 isoform X2 [Pecten maximus]
MDLYSGPGPAVPLKLNVYQSNVGSRHNSTHYSRPALTVFWWPLSNSFDELTGYEISMQGIKGVAKGTRRCFVIDTRYSNVTANDQAIYNFSISPVFTNSAYHFRILSLPHMRSRGASNTAIVETRRDLSRTAPSEWTTRVDCEVRFDLDLPKVYVEYDLPPVAFKFPGVAVELVLDDNVISKQLSTKPFHLFEAMKNGNYQVWVTPDDPYIYSPRACLCRNSDDVCAGSCLMSYGYCDVTQRDESIGEIVESPTGLARPLVICLTVSAVVIGVIVTLTFFVYRHCRRLKDRQKKTPNAPTTTPNICVPLSSRITPRNQGQAHCVLLCVLNTQT